MILTDEEKRNLARTATVRYYNEMKSLGITDFVAASNLDVEDDKENAIDIISGGRLQVAILLGTLVGNMAKEIHKKEPEKENEFWDIVRHVANNERWTDYTTNCLGDFAKVFKKAAGYAEMPKESASRLLMVAYNQAMQERNGSPKAIYIDNWDWCILWENGRKYRYNLLDGTWSQK